MPPAQRKAIAALRLGKRALYTQPLAPPHRWRRVLAAAGDGDTWERRVNTYSDCARCGAAAECPFHVLTECTYPPAVAARDEMLREVPALVARLVLLAVRAAAGGHAAPAGAGAASAAQARGLAARTDWQSAEGRFVLFRLLAVAPWDAAAAPNPAEAPLASTLGGYFDATLVKPHRIRPLANAWVSWAGRWVERVTGAWFADAPAERAARDPVGSAAAGNARGPHPPPAGGEGDSSDSDSTGSEWSDSGSEAASEYDFDAAPAGPWHEPADDPDGGSPEEAAAPAEGGLAAPPAGVG